MGVDLPAADDAAGLSEYVETVVEAIGDRRSLVLVAQSLGAFTAPIVCEHVPVDLLVLVNAMIPAPGESGNEWWTNTSHEQAKRAGRQGWPAAHQRVRCRHGLLP